MSGLDFDLHGVVGIRVVGATSREIRALRAQLGPMERELQRPPDITVRFVPRLSLPGLRYVEPGRSGFTDEGYYLLSHRRRPVVVRMPFDRSEPPCEVVCEHGPGRVPMLEDWIRLIALARGHAPLHASGFELEGTGVLVAGGPHGGKTSCLLAFARTGARFLSDDLVLLSGDGRTMHGLPTDITVADWQLDQLPGAGPRPGPVRRSLLAAARQIERLQPRDGHGRLPGLVHAAPAAIRRRLQVALPPASLFEVGGPGTARVGAVFLGLSHAAPEIAVEAVDPARMAGQLAATLRLQLHPLFAHYLGYRFAFPERTSYLLESAAARAESLLLRALADRPTFVVRHPHPVSLEGLRRAMLPFIETAAPSPAGMARPGGAVAPVASPAVHR